MASQSENELNVDHKFAIPLQWNYENGDRKDGCPDDGTWNDYAGADGYDRFGAGGGRSQHGASVGKLVVAGGGDKPDRDLVLVEVRNGIVKDYATGGNSCDALIR